MVTQRIKRRTRDELSAEHNVPEITNASITFATECRDTRVLDDVSINVHRDEMFGIVDESGFDRSMLAGSMLNTIDSPGTPIGGVVFNPPEGGEPIKVNELSRKELRRFRWEQVLMAVQGALNSLNPMLSIDDHFIEALRAHDYDIREGMERARQLISDIYLGPDRALDAYPHELSGGVKQRAFIALSLILDPGVLVMDEPTAALDLPMQQPILKFLSESKAEYNLTTVIMTYDLSHIVRISNRLMVMYIFGLLELDLVQDTVMDPTYPYTWEPLNPIPDVSADLDGMTSVEGMSLNPLNVPKDCLHHTRCLLTDERCRVTDPDLTEASDDHETTCFYTDEVRETIPLKEEVSK